MKKLNSLQKQKGFTLMEFGVVMVLIIGMMVIFWPQITQMMGMGDASKLRTQVTEIQNGARQYKQRNNVMTGISMTVLNSQGYVSSRMADGAGKNPWGGNYTVAAGSNATQFVVTATGVLNPQIGAQLAADYATSSVAAAFSGTTLTLTFQG